MKKAVRLFVSVRPNAAAIEAWERFRLKSPTWPLRWIPSESLHITLKFLGDTNTDLQPAIVTALESNVRKVPMTLGLKSGGIFPGKGADAIFWAGVDGDTEKLSQLMASLESVCSSLGFKAETRPFLPHITVARLRSDFDTTKKAQWLHQAYQDWIGKFESMPFVVNNMSLMKSSLTATGPRYEEVANIGF